MVIGVLSDIHDNLLNLEKALEKMAELKVETLVFCGDFCSPFAAKRLAETQLPVHAVFGNNDGDQFAIQKVTAPYTAFRLYGEYIGDEDSLLVIDGIRIGVTHYPYYAKPMVKTGWYDCVFYGHSHKADKQLFAGNLMLNPGEIAGVFGQPSFAYINSASRSSEIVYF
jgi:putative phosphoesterase